MLERLDQFLIQPKGYKYWIHTQDEVKIDPNAPTWAKNEFKEYMELMSMEPDKNGVIRVY
ncbi:hypothetical protein GKC44_15360 [Lactobacillus parabuchneri]|uniref:Uncharacterized protein n=1 Tax=Lentilactobacillus parabuchneri TaxID=152331 RepID=A0A844EPQ3_9LACO|nr:hypothetical protein [Lentilactobacillus parabuchneri]